MRDLSERRFGRQVAIRPMGRNQYRNVLWLCKCDCGNEHVVASGKLVQGKSKSCGCLAKEIHIKQLEKHGITTGGKPRTFIIWNGMKARCLNEKSVSYSSYGARGISICNEWMEFSNFHYWAINNGYQDYFQIDRIDNDGDYCPENCRWIPAFENRKKQRKARLITICGETKNVSDWCRILNISKSTAYKYINESEANFIEFAKGQQYFINIFLVKEDGTNGDQ